MKHITERIKAFVEKWQHRLQGHLLVTVLRPDGSTTEFWAVNIFSHDVEPWLVADLPDGEFYNLFPTDDVTITGA